MTAVSVPAGAAGIVGRAVVESVNSGNVRRRSSTRSADIPLKNMPTASPNTTPASAPKARVRRSSSTSSRSVKARAAASICPRVGHEAGPGIVEAKAPAQFARTMLRSIAFPSARAAARVPVQTLYDPSWSVDTTVGAWKRVRGSLASPVAWRGRARNDSYVIVLMSAERWKRDRMKLAA